MKVAIEGGRAVGVIVERDGQTETVAATRVVIRAGAVQTPALLWRSGIGPAPSSPTSASPAWSTTRRSEPT